ncbi:hypothetical protein RIR_jg31932.t1 [Rhizophagus irregularis DAOM 181602=DAOM 197198]|nr:hypothetical protein RIR_jg31932.t1 [Rhizophagus irregularis DAOM 181602=DAOM 197198]
MSMDKSKTQYKPAVEFVSEFNLIFYQNITHQPCKLYLTSSSYESHFFQQFGDIGNVIYDEGVMDDGLDESSNEKLDDDEDDLVINMIRI